MREYDDATRGTFQDVESAKQLVSFDGMKFMGKQGYKNVTPTDIDGFIQLDNENTFIFFELKYSGGMPKGQEQAYEKLCDAIEKGGASCAVFLAEHDVKEDTIIAKDAMLTSVYFGGSWKHEKRGRTLGSSINSYLNWLKETQGDEEMEDKAIITTNLAATLRRTREFKELTALSYYGADEIPNAPGEEYVVAAFTDRPSVRICVTADSGIALIRDVLRGLGEL